MPNQNGWNVGVCSEYANNCSTHCLQTMCVAYSSLQWSPFKLSKNLSCRVLFDCFKDVIIGDWVWPRHPILSFFFFFLLSLLLCFLCHFISSSSQWITIGLFFFLLWPLDFYNNLSWLLLIIWEKLHILHG